MKTDLLILGAGPGGYVAAIRASRMGIKTTLVERHKVGGVCLNYGCIPTKTLLSKTALLAEVRKARRFGLSAENVNLDFAKLSSFKERVVKGLVMGIEKILLDSGVEIIREEGRFIDETKLELSSGETVEFNHAIIATGSRNRDLERIRVDGHNVIDSTGALSLNEAPASLLVIGAGAIGLEIGTIFARLGTRVTVVEMMPEILPGMDAELCRALRIILTKEGMKFHLGTTVKTLKPLPNGGIEAEINGINGQLKAEKALLAVGRAPNTESLERLSFETISGGFLKVSDSLDTSVPGIKAVGDVTGPPLLAHRASHQGIYAVEVIAGRPPEVEPPPIPGAVFTEPELAAVGYTKKAAEEELGVEAVEHVFPLQAVSRARAVGVSEGAFKIVSDETGKILGAHILAPNAGELIAEASFAMRLGLTVRDLAETIHIHPTLSEGLMETALLAEGRGIHI